MNKGINKIQKNVETSLSSVPFQNTFAGEFDGHGC